MKKIKTSPYVPTTVEVQQISATEAKVIAYPFETGYAVTVAHPLRRLLLGSSVGYAPTSIKIEGVTHEFDSVRGMHEDVAIFIINLKAIRFRLKEGVDRVEVNYSFTGSREIKGKDLANSDVEVVTPDLHLATINEDGALNVSIVIQRGIGYVPSEMIRDEITTDRIPLDAFFTPVKKVVYDLENVLVEDNPNYEKIVFTIVTDGQIDPLSAFKNALAMMQQQMSVFNSELHITSLASSTTADASPELNQLIVTIEDLNLSARSFNCLDRAEIKYLGELVLMDENELKEIKNLGKKSLDEIKAKLEELGYPAGTKLETSLESSLRDKIASLKS